jgi:MFS family permease
MIGMTLVTIGMGYNSNQPGMAGEFLEGQMNADSAAMLGATMISVAAVGNIIGKVVFGIIVDKLGIKMAFALFLAFFLVAFIIWILFHTPVALLIGAFFFGTHNAIVSVGWALLIRELFGAKNYTQILSIIGMPSSIVGGVGSSIVAYFYQLGGSYQGALYFGVICVILIAVVAFVALSKLGKVPFDDLATKDAEEKEGRCTHAEEVS